MTPRADANAIASAVASLLRTGATPGSTMHESDSETHAASCTATRKVVYEFLDDEMPASDAERVNQHLLACPPCAGFFDFERAYLLALKRGATLQEAPPALRERLRAALASRSRQQKPD